MLAIVGIAAAIATPRYAQSLARYRAESAAHRVAADLAYAQSRARLDGVSRSVSFNVGADGYTMPGVKDPDTGSAPYVVGLGEEPYRATIITASFDDPMSLDVVNEVIFDGYGKPDSAGTVTVKVGSITFSVNLAADSGKATVNVG